MTRAINDKSALGGILVASAGAFAFLVWLIYFKASPESVSDSLAFLPSLNALMNGLSACCILGGLAAIKTRRTRLHAGLMITAFGFSTLFLIGYVVYHNVHGDTKFLGTGWIRPTYFFILISHIACTFFALPLILTTFYFAITAQFERHKKIVKATLPVWLYVSITGVTIYLLLRAHS